MKKKLFTITLALSIAVAMPLKLFGWGDGHDHVNRLALTVMPPEIKAFLGEANAQKFVRWSHVPDDFTPWTELKNVTLCAEDLEVLKQQGMNSPYALHSHKGHAINFILLVKAFHAQEPERAAFWMSTLMHTIADELACNHDPLIHIMTYGFKAYGMDMGEGIGVDFADVAKTEAGDAVIQEILKDAKLRVTANDGQSALLKLMMSAIEGNAYMTQRGSRIAASYAAGASDAVRRDSIHAMAELGVQGIQESLNVILTAWELAKKNQIPEFNDALEREYQLAAAEFGKKRALRHDSLFTKLLDEETEIEPYVGALVEPSISMNQAKLGFSSKLITASIVRTMRKHGKPCRFVDLRVAEQEGFPVPSKMPLLVICAGSFHVSKEVKSHLAAYTASGGKLLWIGGGHGEQLGELSKAMQQADPEIMPVSNKYGEDSLTLTQAVIGFCPEFEQALGAREYRFTHNPNTPAGWQKPVCNYYIKRESDNIVPLAELTVDGHRMIVAAAYKSSAGAAQYLFLPEYLVSPYLLSHETAIKDPSQPILDSFGTKILQASVKVLLP
ncbi:MAG: hypothetical protein PHO37_00385 [Kiritimatiellae bacterium]|nr:hypothetical protein [Kiritimatiellia bacterium]